MTSNVELLRMRDKSKIWQKYCGFLDFTASEFLEIQEHLLLEQLKAVSASPLSRIIMQGKQPGTIDEFRQQVPLTTYAPEAGPLGSYFREGRSA
jgi:hypothetical protein